MRKLNVIAIVVLGILMVPFVIWNISFGLIIAIPLVALFVFGYWRVIKHQSFKWFYYSIAIGFVIYLLALPITTSQINHKQDKYSSIINNGGELNNIQMVNIYGYHTLMAGVGYFIYPEASISSFLMMTKHENDSVFIGGNNFFFKSKKLNEYFKTHKHGTYAWPMSDYEYGNPEARVALALNILTFDIEETEHLTIYNLTAPMYYDNCTAVLVKSDWINIKVNEGLFEYLTMRGWLHAYSLTWGCVFMKDM